eukprot:scaffold23325_cov127-Isochrysis_galbana.AAC.2
MDAVAMGSEGQRALADVGNMHVWGGESHAPTPQRIVGMHGCDSPGASTAMRGERWRRLGYRVKEGRQGAERNGGAHMWSA